MSDNPHTPPTQAELDALKALCESATPGPWEADLSEPFTLGGDCREVCAMDADGMQVRGICTFMLDTDGHPNGKDFLEGVANAKVLAIARTELPRLITEVERLRALDAVGDTDIAHLNAIIGRLTKEQRLSRCPFCLEDNFDSIGLKHHLLAGHCHPWNTTSSPWPAMQKKETA